MNSQPNMHIRPRRWSPLTVVALPALLLLTIDPRAAVAGSPKSSKSGKSGAKQAKPKADGDAEPKLEIRKAVNQIDGLTVEELDDGTTILRLLGNLEPTFNVYRLSDPDRLVVDISKSERGKAVPHVPVDSWAVGRVTISSVEEHDRDVARVVVNLKRESSYIVVPKGPDLVITITPKEVAPEAYFARKSAGKRQAEIETMKADAQKQAKALETDAKAKVATAERKASTAEDRAMGAEQRAKAAEQRAIDAAEKARKAELEAAEIREQAEAVKARAEVEAKKLARAAEARAKQLEDSAAAKAKQVEAKATADATKRTAEASANAKKLEAEAEKLEAEAKGTLSEAKKLAEARRAKLDAAEQLAAEAERKAKHAEDRASEAKAEAVTAEAYAVRVRADAEAKAKQAEELLGQAKQAMADAEQDSAQAKAAHAEAKLALSEAKKAARKPGKRDDDQRRELERAVEQAEAATAAAKQREQQATTRLAELERDHTALEQALAAKQAEATALETELGTTKGALADARGEVEAAKHKYERLGGDQGPSEGDKRAHRKAKAELAKAETDLAKLSGAAEAERKKLDELREQVAEAGEQLHETLAANEARESLTKQWDDQRHAAGVATIRDVRFEDGPKEARVVVDLDGPVIYDASSLTPNMTMLELRDVQIPLALERSLDTTSFHGPIDRITSFREGDDVKIVVASGGGEAAGIELDRAANRLIWRFPKLARDSEARLASRGPNPDLGPESGPDRDPGAEVALEPRASKRPSPAAEDAGAPARTEVVSLGGNKVSGFSTPPVFAARPGASVGSRNRWRGERIDIELQDAPIKDVLLLFSDIGRVNIIAGAEVQGTVTMKLSAVPWDQALDIILRSLQLGMVQEGNVIRVTTQTGLEEERRKAIEEANAQVQLKALETRLIPLSYATVADMLPKVQSVLSSRGSVTPDSRTNTLIVMDVAENIALAESLVRQLDSQTPQVLIEARIVEARTNWLRQLGIQWGFDFIASPGTGNPTGLLFPNSIGLAGGSGSNQSPVRGLILPGAAANPNYAVDLPAAVSTGAGGALGFSFGSLSGNLNTNLRLSAAEDEGEVRIISAPKIVTLDNTEAQIEQGVQIPISQVSAQGVNTRYVNATLGLRVTPHVTNEGAVLLEVQVQKNEADFVNTGARGDPTILTKSAQSQLLITDGDTAVIGGIYTRNQAVNRNKVPWFGDIPIIGWFFKNKTERDDRSEMLIFLTPRIVNRSTSIGG
jgi:type IV pilus assembly protein PilQ